MASAAQFEKWLRDNNIAKSNKAKVLVNGIPRLAIEGETAAELFKLTTVTEVREKLVLYQQASNWSEINKKIGNGLLKTVLNHYVDYIAATQATENCERLQVGELLVRQRVSGAHDSWQMALIGGDIEKVMKIDQANNDLTLSSDQNLLDFKDLRTLKAELRDHLYVVHNEQPQNKLDPYGLTTWDYQHSQAVSIGDSPVYKVFHPQKYQDLFNDYWVFSIEMFELPDLESELDGRFLKMNSCDFERQYSSKLTQSIDDQTIICVKKTDEFTKLQVIDELLNVVPSLRKIDDYVGELEQVTLQDSVLLLFKEYTNRTELKAFLLAERDWNLNFFAYRAQKDSQGSKFSLKDCSHGDLSADETQKLVALNRDLKFHPGGGATAPLTASEITTGFYDEVVNNQYRVLNAFPQLDIGHKLIDMAFEVAHPLDLLDQGIY